MLCARCERPHPAHDDRGLGRHRVLVVLRRKAPPRGRARGVPRGERGAPLAELRARPDHRRADAGSADEELARRRGLTLAEARAMHEETERMGAEIGIRFDFARARRGNTFDAHRVLHMAQAEGRQAEHDGPAARGLLQRGRADRRPRRAGAGGGRGGPRSRPRWAPCSRATTTPRTSAATSARRRSSASRAVPFFVIDRRFGLAGAHPAETLRQAIEQARST